MIKHTLPNKANPLPDETLLSYLERLAHLNSVDSAKRMIRLFSSEEELKSGNVEVRAGLYDLPSLLGTDLSETLNLYMRTALTPFLGLFLPPDIYTKYINLAFRQMKPGSVFRRNVPQDLFQQAKVCPDCAKHELKTYGFWYFHRAHQIPGVRVCSEHKCSLMTVSRSRDFMRMPVGSTYELSDPDLEYSYAETCALLLQDLPDINADDVKRHLKEKNYGIHSLHQSVREKSHSLDIRNTLTSLIETEGKESVMNTFEMMERTANNTANDCTLPDAIHVMTHQRSHPILAKCKTCGHEFITSPAALAQGWGCPLCGLKHSDTEIMAKLVDSLGKGAYELKSEITNLKSMTLLHRECGREITVDCGSFLSRGRRCSCKKTVPIEMMRRRVEQTGGFTLLDYKGTATKVLVKSKCGHEFRTSYHTLERSGFKCPVCTSQEAKAKNRFELFVAHLDDNYTVEDWIDGLHVRMRHEACGRSHVYNRKTFLSRGVRCPCLTVKRSRQDDFLDYIRDTIKAGVTFTSTDERILAFGSYSSVHHLLSRLYAKGMIEKTRKGYYKLTDNHANDIISREEWDPSRGREQQ